MNKTGKSRDDLRQHRRAIAEAVRNGGSLASTANRFDVCGMTVRNACAEHGVAWAGKRVSPGADIRERIMRNVSIIPINGCWMWMASLDPAGYGRMGVGKSKSNLAHRVSYIAHVGPIPEGMEIDHLCRSRWCVNPHHLEAVPKQVNYARALSANGYSEERCKRGHKRDGNTYLYKNPNRPSAQSMCRICRDIAVRAYHTRKSLQENSR